MEEWRDAETVENFQVASKSLFARFGLVGLGGSAWIDSFAASFRTRIIIEFDESNYSLIVLSIYFVLLHVFYLI